MRVPFSWLLVFPLIGGLGIPAPATPPRPPNVVVILADDQGWGDLGLHGHPSLRTPRIDELARSGAQFDRFYVQPVCAPTRAEFLIGRYHLRGGVYDVSRGGERLALREQTLADAFRAAGYATGFFGKWHNGSQYPYHPNGRGFDEFYGFTSGHWGSYFDASMDHNGAVVKGRGYMTDDLTDHTLRFIEQQQAAGRPFLTCLAVNTPHSPMQVPDAYYDAWAPRTVPRDHRFSDREDPAHTRAALAMVENIDHNVGRVLDTLDALKIADDTIVIYFSDNGPNGWRWNGEFKGIKGHTDEGGVRSPLFIRWPGRIPTGTVIPGPAAAIDLLPTLTGLAQIPFTPKPDQPLDGASWASVLLGASPTVTGRWIFAHWRGDVSVRGERWMLDRAGDLFDLADDPHQRSAVTAKHPARVARLREHVAAWRADMASTGAPADPAITVGHPDARLTPLPARDAFLHGGLERSNPYPNDSYVRHWTSPEDKLTWSVDVPVAGRFAAFVYYTCPVEDTGALLRLEWATGHIQTTLDSAWNPPVSGQEHDRIPRQESYVKDFRPLALGEFHLPAGPTTLTLSCPKIPGATALEFKLLQIERLD